MAGIICENIMSKHFVSLWFLCLFLTSWNHYLALYNYIHKSHNDFKKSQFVTYRPLTFVLKKICGSGTARYEVRIRHFLVRMLASSQNERAQTAVPTQAQCRFWTPRTPLNFFAGECKFYNAYNHHLFSSY